MIKNGFAIDNRELAENGCCIAVPMRDHEGNIIASLSFSGFVGIEDPIVLEKYLPALQKASEKISRKFICELGLVREQGGNKFQTWG